MQKAVRGSLSVVLAGMVALSAAAQQGGPANAPARPAAPPAPPMLLTSPSFADGSKLPTQYSCAATTPPPTGPRNISLGVSPALQWTNVPAGTASFMLVLHDPDAHTPKMPTDITHWIVFNIPGDARELPGGALPDVPLPNGGLQGKNMMGRAAYQGPCATGILHHYIFELYALDQKLDLPQGSSREDIEKAAVGHVLKSAVYIAMFAR